MFRRHIRRTTLQIDIHPTRIRLRVELQPLLLTNPLHHRLDLLNVSWRVIALAHNDVQMVLTLAFGGADPRLEDALGFVDVLPVQVDGVGG